MSSSNSLHHYLRSPWFWILFFLLVRLMGITNPPLEITHSWRQITGLMVAKNFLVEDANLFLPRVDLEGGGERVIGMEFPLLNYLHYGVSLLFSYDHWYGRLINLIISSIGIFYLSKTLEKAFDRKTSLYSILALIVSIYFIFSRKMMPDTFSMGLVFISLYHGFEFFRKGKKMSLLYYGIFFLLGVLSKLPAILGVSPLLLFLFSKEINKVKKVQFSVLSSIALIPIYYWYFIWNPHLSEKYGSWYNSGMSWKEGSLEILGNLSNVWENFSFHAFYGYGFFLLFLLGLLLMIWNKDRKVIYLVVIYFFFASLYIIRSGFYFHHHSYYMIPILPVMAFLVGYLLSSIKAEKWSVVLILICGIESIANQQHDLRLKDSELYKLEAETLVDQHLSESDKIVVVSEGNPQLLYFSNREGWLRNEGEIDNSKYMKELAHKGAKAILIDKKKYPKKMDRQLLAEDKHFLLYEL